ncbi:e3 ubiquitin-protein ligase ttc3 [Limosa lapponica baueri]|uniref:E3 ubiquitin-protein ligase ttc3 n=1 Tax=Limosa lapponica baueri TaxID=1758121 RepID=A0A2I0U1M5_LIMLA|nr:e3 ubiquitin-protein ligase ttc3 [Limosa lapponica baueri]
MATEKMQIDYPECKPVMECLYSDRSISLKQNVPPFIGGILRIGSRIENGVFDIGDALDWVRYTGDVSILQRLEKLGDFGWIYLEIFFAECKRYITKVALEDCNLVEEFKAVTCENCRKNSESMKQKGNEEFSQGNFDHAIMSYTKAIEFWRALADGKRATILKPNWPKGHYHFCKALSLLGEHELALEANERAQELCKNILDGLKDLIQQNDKLKKTLEEINGQSHQSKGRPKTKTGDSEKTRDHLDSKTESKAIQDKLFCNVQQVDLTMLPEEVKSLVRDGYTALMDQRCHSAEQAFSQLLSILNPSELKQLNLRIINYVVIIYGHATALLGIGQPELILKNCIEECKFPPEPDAICRYQQCHGHSKIQIFFTDPDFKDFLQELCFTPDCKGFISKIVIFNSSGYVQDLYAGDRVLQHISRNAERIKTAVRDASKLLKELLSWFVISEEDYMSYSKTSSMSHEVMEQLISYLIHQKDRVKTRGFIHVLSELEEVDPKLHKWLKHLNNLGRLYVYGIAEDLTLS